MKTSGKSIEISEKLRQEIFSGKFDLDRRLPSDRMLMRRFAVARATVQAAMKDLMDRHLVVRRPGYGTFLSDHAQTVASGRFGIIVPDAYYPFYAQICRGIDDAARSKGWITLSAALGSGDMHDRAAKALEFAEVCVREKVGGIFFQPFQFLDDGAGVNLAILGTFKKADIPVVLLDSDFLPLPRRSDYDLVGIDNMQAGYEMARHVIAQGAKRILYFSNPLPAPTSLDRGNGVGVAVTEAGLRWTRESIFFADPCDVRAARRVFESKNSPDAIVAVNDYVASLLLKTLKSIGRRVPDDVLLAGFNGDPVSEETDPQLTTGVQPCHEIGVVAVGTMLQRIENPRTAARAVQLAVKIVTRESTQRKRSAKGAKCR